MSLVVFHSVECQLQRSLSQSKISTSKFEQAEIPRAFHKGTTANFVQAISQKCKRPECRPTRVVVTLAR